MKINKPKCNHINCNCQPYRKIGRYSINEDRRQILQEGTKYDKKAITKLASSGLFDEETSTKIVNALFREDIHAFVHSPSWLEKYLIGIVNMLIKYANGDKSRAKQFLEDSIEPFEEYLTYIKELRPTLEQEKQLALDKTFNEEMSYEDMLQELKTIRDQRDAESAEKLKNTEFGEDSDFELVEIDSFEDFNSKFGGRATGDGSSDKYAGGGGTAWCHTNSQPTYNSWVAGDKKFFVLAHKDWENIPFDKESNSNNPKDDYGNSLIAILVSKGGKLLKATLRCNHIGVPSNADNQYKTYAELSEVVGFNVEVAVKEALGVEPGTEDEDVETCENCGATINEDESRTTPDGEVWCEDCFFDRYEYCYGCDELIDKDYDNWYWGPDGNPYCESCFDEKYFMCNYCGDTFDFDDGLPTDDGWYCTDCAERKGWVECCDCDEVVTRDYAYYTHNDWYCEDCYHKSYFYCDKCGEDYYRDEEYDTPDGPVCEYCFNNYYAVCEICDEIFSKDDGTLINGCWYCDSCFEESHFVCDGCGAYYGNDVKRETDDGEEVCPDCYKSYVEDNMEESVTKPTSDKSKDKTYDDLEDDFNLNEFLELHGIR